MLPSELGERVPRVLTLPSGRNGDGDDVAGLGEFVIDQLDCDEIEVRLVTTGVGALEDSDPPSKILPHTSSSQDEVLAVPFVVGAGAATSSIIALEVEVVLVPDTRLWKSIDWFI